MQEKLRNLLNNSYTPYYKYPVSCVIVMNDGREFSGVNVETSSPASGICAERNAIYSSITEGYGKGSIKEGEEKWSTIIILPLLLLIPVTSNFHAPALHFFFISLYYISFATHTHLPYL